MSTTLKDKLALLPRSPGIYKLLNNKGEILYIGKALNLKNRVPSYFSGEEKTRPRLIPMIPLIKDIEIIETANEIEALVLESALIKKYQPKYNSDKRDDKSYAWLYIDTQNQYPTVKIVRSISTDEYKKGKLFGPYPSGRAIKRVFKYLRKLYPFCTNKHPKQDELCFYYHLGLCPGPYQNKISKRDYRKNINNIIRFLQGRKTFHLKDLEKEMRRYAKTENFEKAAELRDRLNDLKHLGTEINFSYEETEDDYIEKKESKAEEELKALAEEIEVDELERIECYDISNIKGQLAYGSMVVALKGLPDNSMYRVFKIKELSTPNDPAMLKEVLERRLKHVNKSKDESLKQKPSLILIDGAKSQLGVLNDTIPEDITLMGISKGKHLKRGKQKQIDEYWIRKNGEIEPIKLRNIKLFITLRDEAHRFALLHHRKLRKYVQKKSILDDIPGIGIKRRKALIKTFGSVERIKKAKAEDINKVVKNKAVTENILKTLASKHSSQK